MSSNETDGAPAARLLFVRGKQRFLIPANDLCAIHYRDGRDPIGPPASVTFSLISDDQPHRTFVLRQRLPVHLKSQPDFLVADVRRELGQAEGHGVAVA